MTCYDLQLRKRGILVTREWEPETREYVEREIKSTDLAFHLDDTLCFDKGVTLKDVFVFLAMDIGLFSGVAGCPFLDELIDEAFAKPYDREEFRDGMAALEIRRYMVVEEDEEDGPYLHTRIEFYGTGKEEAYAIEFTPVNELAGYPIFLNEDLKITSSIRYANRTEGYEEKEYLTTKMKFTLRNVMCGILDELSFMGPPESRIEALKDLKNRVDEVKGGKAELVELDWDKMEKELEEKAEKYKKPCRICGEDARSCHFNKPPDLCIKCFRKSKEN